MQANFLTHDIGLCNSSQALLHVSSTQALTYLTWQLGRQCLIIFQNVCIQYDIEILFKAYDFKEIEAM